MADVLTGEDAGLLLQTAIGALTEATKVMSQVAQQVVEVRGDLQGHKNVCDLRERTTEKALTSLAGSIEKLADTVERNARQEADDRSALSKRIAEEAEARRKELANDQTNRRAFLQWIIGALIAVVSVATAVIVATRSGP